MSKLENRPSHNQVTVLVVDDEDALCSTYQQILEKYGYRVLVARHGQGALDLYTKNSGAIAAVVTDMMMPGMSGDGLIRRLRELSTELGILAVSGVSSEDIFSKAILAGASRFLAKPFSVRALIENLKEVLPAAEKS